VNFGANEGASNVVAVQYGSLAVGAKWIDITADNSTKGCFGVEIADGQLCGILGDFAVVQAESNSPAPTRTIETLPDSGKLYFNISLLASDILKIGRSRTIVWLSARRTLSVPQAIPIAC
jgi:hypothetical protein